MRVTRAALRAQAQEAELFGEHSSSSNTKIHEDGSDDDLTNSGSEFADSERPALRDITIENYPTPEINLDQIKELTENSTGTTPAKAKSKVKGGKKHKTDHTEAEVSEIQDTSSFQNYVSDVTEEAPTQTKEENLEQTPVSAELESAPALEDQTDHLATPVRSLSLSNSKTPRFDPELHASVDRKSMDVPIEEDSFVDSIKTRSPSKFGESQKLDSSFETQEQESTFPLEKSISRTSSVRSSSRIEDSVEAIDALEEALEKVSEELPLLANIENASIGREYRASPKPTTPSKVRQITAKTPRTAMSTVKLISKPLEKATVPKTPRVTASRISTARPMTKAREPIVSQSKTRGTSSQSLDMKADSKLSTSHTTSKTEANIMKKRVTSGGVLSTSRTPFVPTKSTKPTTTSSFVLPGEAIAAKLKLQREERLKREESNLSEVKQPLKARPAPKMASRPSVMPRENKASKARLSMMTKGNDKENIAPKTMPTSSSAASRKSILNVPKSRVTSSETKQSPTMRRTVGEPTTASTVRPTSRPSTFQARITSTSSTTSQSTTKLASVRPTGKEVFNRGKRSLEQAEKEKKEKEEAARKARAEAAERGRQASREWAERQKLKQMKQSSNMAKEGVTV